MPTFELTENQRLPGCREIQVIGELDLAVADRLQRALDRAGAESSQILISLEKCEFIDSTGIAVIVAAHQKLDAQGGRLAVYGPSDQVLRILSVTGLTDNGLVFASAEEALDPHPSLRQ